MPFDSVGGRIKQRREELGLGLTELAERAQVSRSYLWNLENKEQHQKPSAQTLYAIAEVLGTTMSDLLGRRLLNEPSHQTPDPTLLAFAEARGLSDVEVRQLASIEWRGAPPRTEERWRFIYDALKASKSLDH